MRSIQWNIEKNKKLVAQRGISFEEIFVCIENSQIAGIIENPSKKYKNQKVFVVELNKYFYYVPFVEEGNNIFLKTIIPSRKLTKKYLKEGDKNA